MALIQHIKLCYLLLLSRYIYSQCSYYMYVHIITTDNKLCACLSEHNAAYEMQVDEGTIEKDNPLFSTAVN